MLRSCLTVESMTDGRITFLETMQLALMQNEKHIFSD